MPSRTTACRARRRQPGSLLASSWRHRGRCPVAPARSEAEAAANAQIVVGDVSQDVVEIPTGLTPAVGLAWAPTAGPGAVRSRQPERCQRAYHGGGRLRMLSRFRPHATRPGPPAVAAHHRQSGDPDRIPAARRAQRPAHGRPLRASDRHHRAPGISRSWQQNGRRTAQ